ncbi:MAG: PAS domain S-box protein, partial [Planctomycetes bacterium]|nr:PAS domain S-box protein [Planctomycetota bacterium]
GYAAEEVIGQPISMLAPPERSGEIARILEAIEQGKHVDHFETVRRTKDGRLIDVSLTISPIRDMTGRVAGASAIARDITAYKRAEKALRESEEKYRGLYDSLRDGIVRTDMAGRILEVNQAYLDMIGYARDEITQLTHQQITPAQWQRLDADILALEIMPQGHCRVYEKEYVKKDGTVFPISTRVWVARDAQGDPAGLWAIVRDITERKRAEEQLRQLNAQLEQRVADRTARLQRQTALVEGVNKVLRAALTSESEADLARTCLAVAEALTGSRMGFIGEVNPGGRFDCMAISDPGWAACRIPESNAVRLITNMELRGLWAVPIKQGRSEVVSDPLHHPGRVGLPEGHPPLTSYLGVPLKRGGKTIGVISLANKDGGYDAADQQDIEALSVAFVEALMRKRAEVAIRRLNEDLERRRLALEAANQELEAFNYSVSHDLRGPLRGIDGFSRILLQSHAPHLSAEGQRYLRLVRENAQQMGRLIDDLLTLSRLGRQAVRSEPVAPIALVHEVLRELNSAETGRRIETIIADLPPCQADPVLLKQVFVNLLDNALKFTRKREAARVEVGCLRQADQHVYFVKDNGVGFDMQYADKLFGVFQRLHRMEDYEGTGVGLAIAHRIIGRHGGRIWAEAEPDKGATFFFTVEGGQTPPC